MVYPNNTTDECQQKMVHHKRGTTYAKIMISNVPNNPEQLPTDNDNSSDTVKQNDEKKFKRDLSVNISQCDRNSQQSYATAFLRKISAKQQEINIGKSRSCKIVEKKTEPSVIVDAEKPSISPRITVAHPFHLSRSNSRKRAVKEQPMQYKAKPMPEYYYLVVH